MNKLFIVGIGPGSYENMTIAADSALKSCEVIIGYGVYVELVKERYPDKELFTTPMTKEVDRCKAALDIAKSGRGAALICSGDSGIYGMAALAYELRGESCEPEIEVISGITAAISGAAVLGAPLTHDFSVISLSDRLTEWELIEKRLIAAAEADMVIALYNPASRTRPEHLKNACDILLRHIPANRICGVVRNIGRMGQESRLMSLGELREYEADMFCTVFIGSSKSRITAGKMITPRGYRDV